MLPHPSSPEFPAALKSMRESLGLSRSALAQAAGIHTVMPRRYEEPNCSEFTRPTEKTMLALNRALGLSNVTSAPQTKIAAITAPVLLCDASTDQIVAELRHRGVAATLTFPTV
jgi:transcriptional regulator with XRE-family HTH domain